MIREGKSWDIRTIHLYFKSVFSWIYGEANFRFIYKEAKINYSYKIPFSQINSCVVTTNPFQGVADLDVLIAQSDDEIKERYESKKLKEKIKTISKLKKPPTLKFKKTFRTKEEMESQTKERKENQADWDDYYRALANLEDTKEATLHEMKLYLGESAKPKIQLMSNLFGAYHRSRSMREYHSVTYRPFSNLDPTPYDVCNLFTGFPLAKYRNKMDITKTLVWKWLFVAVCDRRKHKIDYMLNYFAMKLQCPVKKIQKILILYGTTGVGKTSARYFIQAIFSKESVRFCENMAQFEDKFNSLSLGKLFCIVDDVEKLTKQQSESLKSKTTNDTFQYRKMRCDPIEMPSYEDLITTSNSDNPHIAHNNRRSELIVMNPELKAGPNQTFEWSALYEELGNNQIMGAWFEFLATRDISKVVFNNQYRFSETEIVRQKLTSLPSSQQFLFEFFAKHKFWIHHDYNYKQLRVLFRCSTTKLLERKIIVQTRLFYDWYYLWVTKSGRKCKTQYQNFYASLKEFGLTPTRCSFEKDRYTVIELIPSELKKGISDFLKIPIETIHFDWHHLNIAPDTWVRLTKGDEELLTKHKTHLQFK